MFEFGARDGVPPATAYATQDTRAGGSTPAEAIPVLDFDAAASEYMDFYGVLPEGYDGGGLTLTIIWMASTATAEEVRWEVGIHRCAENDDDMDSSHTYDTNGVTDTTNGTCGKLNYCSVAFTNGADMDSLAAGEAFVLRIYRDHDHADDDMSGDAELVAIVGKET
jgi:hypothetical protein